FYAFELMMAPYAVGHLKMSFLLEELGYTLKKDDRFKLYLTSALEMEDLEQSHLPGMASLSEESRLAGRVKKEQPILAIMGNPPYSGHSANKGRWIDQLLKEGYTRGDGSEDEGYYRVDGAPLGEKNPKWLQDDYVKFIRFAQWKIDRAGEGVLGFITNHSYLDNPTFRGMRRSLMNSFDEIYLLDLHGNALKKETCPDGSRDENVFDIRQGTAVALFVKTKGRKKGRVAQVLHADLWGLRKEKYDWLDSHAIATTEWREITPQSEWYLFVPRDERLLELYEGSPKIPDIFPVNSVGIVTARDKFVIDMGKEALTRRIRMLRDEKMPDELIAEPYKLKDKSGWKLKTARKKVRDDEDWEDSFTRILYRPFDMQWIFYHDSMIERSRKEVMRHMVRENLGLMTLRKGLPTYDYSWVFVSSSLVSHGVYYNGNQSTEYLFPLYLYPDPAKKDLLSDLDESKERQPNISGGIVKALRAAYTKQPSPEDIFHYIYAVLYSEVYRTKYAEFLKTDFPRVPFTGDERLFGEMAGCGRHLADLHLMRSPELDTPVARFQGPGDGRVEKIAYDGETKRVYINTEQYFEEVDEDVWEYRIGGYQVCDKWLKDRKGNRLSLDDIRHYCRVATAIERTIALQNEIDELYPQVEEHLIAFGA
ncbi:MAG: DNA methyltransferase, partial [Deltaproteobacteria bacterium]|nr:DNA methyltransferase [Deltaproteobacteria bacterium]